MRTDCDRIRPLLLRYSHRELSASDQRDVGRHLSQCDSCHVAFDWLVGMEREIMAALPGAEPAARISVGRVREQLGAGSPVVGVPSWFRAWSYSLAIVAAVATLTFALLMTDHDLTLASIPAQPAPRSVVLTPTGTDGDAWYGFALSPTPTSAQNILQPVVASILTP